MTPRRFFACRLVAVVCAMFAWLQAMAATSATMEFESQALDLDTGTVSDTIIVDVTESTEADIRFSYHADRVPHCVVVPVGDGVTIAFLDGVSFVGVLVTDIAGLSFSAEPLDVPLDPNDTVVLRTDTGAVFKIGNAVETGFWVTFDYEQMQ